MLTPEQTAALRAQASRPVICQSPQDCAVKWGRALTWARDNSLHNLARITHDYIATREPKLGGADLGFTITRTMQLDGTERIDFDTECLNLFGCVPSALEARADFVSSVMGP